MSNHPSSPRTRRVRSFAMLIAGLAAMAVAASVAAVSVVGVAFAATACRVTYSVSSQWQGGFGATVRLTNLGDPVTSWSLAWTFPAGQTITQIWNANAPTGTSQVTATNASYNGNLTPNATAEFGFNGSWNNSSNPAPTTFTMNGVACTGSPPTSTSTSRPPTTTTRPPTTTSRPPTTTTRPPTTPPTSGWNPPANLVQPLNEVWAHQESTYPNLYGFRNYGWDQIFANRGFVNYCVRWDSSASVSAQLRDEIHAALARQFKKWMDVMAGHNGWPYADVPVRVVGWAVRNRSQLQWTDTSVDIYVNDIRENAPQCAQVCGRFFNQSGNYPNCPGGASRHYDMSLWLTAGFGGGAGGDWGQRMGSEYFVNNRNAANVTILLHEIGHTFGLDDFYDWTPTGQCCFIMKAGSSGQITDFDAWMLRDWWRHLKNRYGL
jgi:Cellulose binding domain